MPPGAKKRKALKKKQQQQKAIGTSNGDNLHGGKDENGSREDRESESNLSSPGSQGNQESAAAMVKETAKDVTAQGLGGPNGTAVERGILDDKKTIVEKNSAENLVSQDPCAKEEIAHVVDSVSKVVISKKSETSTHSDLVKDNGNGKVAATLPGSAVGTSEKVESVVRESEAPLSSEEKRILLPGPPAVRTSWLSCCGFFDAMTRSDR